MNLIKKDFGVEFTSIPHNFDVCLGELTQLESEINIIKLLNSSKKVNDNSYITKIEDIDYLIKTSKDDDKINFIKYKDKLENDVEIKFSNVVQNGEIADGIFKFTVPSNYDVIRK